MVKTSATLKAADILAHANKTLPMQPEGHLVDWEKQDKSFAAYYRLN